MGRELQEPPGGGKMLRVTVGILWMALGSGLVQTLSASVWDFHIPAFAMPGSALRVPLGAAPGPLRAQWSAPSSCPPQGRQVSAAGLLTMMAKGGKGGQQQGRGGGGRQEKTDRSTPEADRFVSKMYEYVRGGFAEKEKPVTGEKSGLYQEFDSALRAASYNMFCSPLKPVNSPASFKAEQEATAASKKKGSAAKKLGGVSDAMKFSGEEADEDPEEVRIRTEAQYKELDRLIQGDKRATSGGNSKLFKMRRKAGMIETKTAPKAPPPSPQVGGVAAESSQPAPEANRADTQAGQRKNKKPAQGASGIARDLAGQLEGLTGRSDDERSGMYAGDEYESSEVVEGYEELQKLLGHKSFGGQKRKLDSARFTGNMTKYREAGMFKRVTLKDPLSRVYAQRLKQEAAPVSKGAIARPSRPGQSTVRGENGDGNAGEGEAATAEAFVDDVLNSIQAEDAVAAPPVRPTAPNKNKDFVKQTRASDAQYLELDALLSGGEMGSGAGSKKVQNVAGTGREHQDKEASPEKPAIGGKGRLVLNHSTHIPGLIDVLNRLVEMDGISTIVPGQLSRSRSNAQRLALRVQSETDQGFKLVARKGTQTQEVYVVCDLERETIEAAIAWSL